MSVIKRKKQRSAEEQATIEQLRQNANTTGDAMLSTTKRPFYKRWWFIALVVLSVIGIFGGDGSTSKAPDSTQEQETISQSASTEDDSKEAEESSTEETKTTEESRPPAVEPAKPQVDKTELGLVIDSATSIENEGYTQETWDAFQETLTAAQAVFDDENATKTEVDAARNAVGNSIMRLFNPDFYQWPSYMDVARTPDDWQYQSIAFSGTVLDVLESTSENYLRLATSGDYDDVVLVMYSPTLMDGVRILEGDSITVYGFCTGLESYTATLGQQITIPGLYAEYIDFN